MTWQLALTTISTVVASGILIRLITVQAEVRRIKAETRVDEEEAATIAFKRMQELAEYYRARLEECEKKHQPPPPNKPPQRGRL